MTSFLLQFQEQIKAALFADAKTATMTKTTRETADQDRANMALMAKTQTLTETRREQPDQDPKYSQHVVFPLPKGKFVTKTPTGDSTKTATATSARESKDQDRSHRSHMVLPWIS